MNKKKTTRVLALISIMVLMTIISGCGTDEALQVYDDARAKKQERRRRRKEVEVDQKIIQKRKLAAGAELQHNIPIISRGQVRESLKMMKGFRNL